MSSTIQVIIVVTAASIQKAVLSAKIIADSNTSFEGFVPLSKNGLEPATHYWSSWAMYPDELVKYQRQITTRKFRPTIYQNADPKDVLLKHGLQTISAKPIEEEIK